MCVPKFIMFPDPIEMVMNKEYRAEKVEARGFPMVDVIWLKLSLFSKHMGHFLIYLNILIEPKT